ncbi:DUF4198 domain-containing protein [Pokkaliibacter sp. CJK22405]|uniref:DUF4198 domain-containing protein n=1 Tax=Pokkaliibacter sp. CJK22405 TaxID=3384615 RepID=UPI003984AA91
MKYRLSRQLLLWSALLTAPGIASAQLMELLPDRPILQDVMNRDVHVVVRLVQPSDQGSLLPLSTPEEVGVDVNSRRSILTSSIKADSDADTTSYSLDYRVNGPGDHIFYAISKPRWEQEAQRMVTEYAKVVVDAYGMGDGWDTLLGFPIEIQPLSRPYALWVGNVFEGIVLRQGEPVPYAELKVVYHNTGNVVMPADSYFEQIIRADSTGTFTYGIPLAGWWGFSTTTLAEQPMKNPEGDRVNHEETATMWIHALDMSKAH